MKSQDKIKEWMDISISLVSKKQKIIFYLQDSPLVSKKMPSCSTSVFYVQDVDYNLLIGSHEIAAPHV